MKGNVESFCMTMRRRFWRCESRGCLRCGADGVIRYRTRLWKAVETFQEGFIDLGRVWLGAENCRESGGPASDISLVYAQIPQFIEAGVGRWRQRHLSGVIAEALGRQLLHYQQNT